MVLLNTLKTIIAQTLTYGPPKPLIFHLIKNYYRDSLSSECNSLTPVFDRSCLIYEHFFSYIAEENLEINTILSKL